MLYMGTYRSNLETHTLYSVLIRYSPTPTKCTLVVHKNQVKYVPMLDMLRVLCNSTSFSIAFKIAKFMFLYFSGHSPSKWHVKMLFH